MSADQIVPERFIDEELADHWRVDETPESFAGLCNQLENKTNFRPFFETAFRDPALADLPDGALVADIGAGVCWTSALMALDPRVRKVYAVEPSAARRASAPHIAAHFGVVPDKVVVLDGTFQDPKIPEPVDLVLMSGSFHHCSDETMPGLFDNVRAMLRPGGRVLVANEHYVGPLWAFRRLLSWGKNLLLRGRWMYYWPGNLHAPDPFDNEHWRRRAEVERIFARAGFTARITPVPGDLCKDKPTWFDRLGWTYYYAVLTPDR
jgi:protein-L-isoaspartate O-methyltransferase